MMNLKKLLEQNKANFVSVKKNGVMYSHVKGNSANADLEVGKDDEIFINGKEKKG
jgi:hypothetical protein